MKHRLNHIALNAHYTFTGNEFINVRFFSNINKRQAIYMSMHLIDLVENVNLLTKKKSYECPKPTINGK